MLSRLSEKLILRPPDLPPSRPDFEVIGVFNPGAAVVNNGVVLLVRVAERPSERREGHTGLPQWSAGKLQVDWLANAEIEPVDARVVRHRSTGLVRLTSVSHLRVIPCGRDGVVTALNGAAFLPQGEVEEFGVEDPRITLLDGRFYFTYVAVSRHGVCTALASTADFQAFERHGVIFCPENKDVVLFPERVDGLYTALHRPAGATQFTRPQMWLARSPDLVHWGSHSFLFSGRESWESGRLGAGPPPIKTADGWLMIYHGNVLERQAGSVGEYSAGALLLDLEHPSRILKRTKAPIMGPCAAFELDGFVPGVVFPTGLVKAGDTLFVYYGAADTVTAVVKLSLEELQLQLS